ncbi:hypothetical protein [Acinetobacter amyesii]|uniref:hypothetical protein n=1 Tax=Acinetobacter amyesii TaxID=2942470 RepID=UPI0020BDA30F|nr:hypothetical protein [Acinetobacter amyesii]MCL6241843.1 hypothetical protein [Acinetobacter amyesii]
MWNWIQEEFYTFLMVLERYPKVWILPCVFFYFVSLLSHGLMVNSDIILRQEA